MSCKAICRKNKTQKGYLCDKIEEPTYFTTKKWCKINNTDVNNYEKYLGKPSKTNGYYWDVVSEENKLQNMCVERGNIIYSECSLSNNLNYQLALLFIKYLAIRLGIAGTFVYGTAEMAGLGATSHTFTTLGLIMSTDKQIAILLIGKLRELCKIYYVEKGIYTQEQINIEIQKLKEEVQAIPDGDKKQFGGFLKNLFQKAVDVIKSNPANDKYATSVMQFFIDQVPDEHKLEVLKGANVVKRDDGNTTKLIETTMDSYIRISSHFRNETSVLQRGNTNLFFDLELHMVSGSFIYADTGEVVSWYQLERSPMSAGRNESEIYQNIMNEIATFNFKNAHEFIMHSIDTLIYGAFSKIPEFISEELLKIKYKGFNLGIGTSIHTDKNPIVIDSRESIQSDLAIQPEWGSQQGLASESENAPEYLILTYSLKELNDTPIPKNVSWSFVKNNFTRLLGIHSDYIITDKNQTISLREYHEQKQLQDYNDINRPNITQGMAKGPNIYIPTANLPGLGSSLAIGRGGKQKKRTRKIRTTNKKRINKRKSRKHIK